MTAVETLETGWLPTTPSGDTVVRAFADNQVRLNAVLARAHGGREESDDEVALSDAGSPVPYLNQAVLRRPVHSAADPLLDRIGSWYAGSAHPATVLSVWPTPDLADRGWELVGHPAFVARPPLPWPVDAPLDGVETRLVDDAPGLVLAEDVVVRGYPLPEAAAPGSAYPSAVLGTGLRLRLGLVDAQAVAAAASFVSDGVVNLCLAATLPEARRRGVWRSLVRERCADAPDLAAVAFTSDYSRPGFVRLGFLPVCRFTLWAVPPRG